MKNNKTILISAFVLILIAVMPSCKKENSDLTKGVTGTYTNTDNNVTVNKIDDTHVSMAFTQITAYGYSVTFTSVKLNSATAFTLNPGVDNSSPYSTDTITGTGTASGNNISFLFAIHSVPNAYGLSLGHTASTTNETVSATK